jgi:hypothetical protein
MLKLIALAACVIGFFFIGPKALAEFRQIRPRTRAPLNETSENTNTEAKPGSDVAA